MNSPRLGWCLAVGASAAMVAGCGSAVRAAPVRSSPSSNGRVLLRGLDMPQAYAAGGQLYVAQRVMPPVNEIRSELIRIDPAAGHIYAVRQLDSTFEQATLTHGSLWVVTSWFRAPRLGNSWLWRLDPRTLAVRARRLLPGSMSFFASATLAVAGGWLWVGNADELDRVSLSSGRVTARIAVAGGQAINVAASASGSTLLVSEGGDRAQIQRRDPHTGAVIASSGIFADVTSPYIGAVIDGVAWISQSGGMMGYVSRLDAATLKSTPFPGAMPHPGVGGPADIWGTNAIRAQLIGGTLWIIQLAGGPQRNYCGDPRTGVSRAPIKLPGWGMFLTADASSVYYVPSVNTTREELDREPTDRRCQGA